MKKLDKAYLALQTSAPKLTKVAPLAVIGFVSVQSVFCTDLFNGLQNIGTTIGKGLMALISIVAFVCILWNVIQLLFHAGDDKAVTMRKNAIITILKYYVLGIGASFILTTIYNIVSEAFSGATILKPKEIDSTGALK